MTRTAIDVRPISGSVGAEISGFDLSGEVGDETIAAIRKAWLDHCVIFFREQNLPPARFLTFAKRFGEVIEYPFIKGLEEYPEIIPVVKLEHEKTNFGGIWHSDTAYLETPPMATMLVAREVPPHGGDTMFANTYLAYETLSDGMRKMLDGLVGINTSAKADASRTREDRVKAMVRPDVKQEYVGEHPVVRTHPETGRKALYVNSRPHVALPRHDRSGKPADPGFPVPAPDQAGVHLPLQLAARLHRLLGQPLRAALPCQRLSRLPPRHASHHAQRRQAALMGCSKRAPPADYVRITLEMPNAAAALAKPQMPLDRVPAHHRG